MPIPIRVRILETGESAIPRHSAISGPVLFAGRLEPQNNPRLLVEAFAQIGVEHARGLKLVIVGGAIRPRRHPAAMAGGRTRVIFPGCVLVNDHRPNAETLGDAGIYFSGRAGVKDLTAQLERLLDNPELVLEYRSRALDHNA